MIGYFESSLDTPHSKLAETPAMTLLNIDDEKAIGHFATQCGCSVEQVRHAITARGYSELAVISYLALRGFITQETFLRRRNEIT